MKMFVLFRVLTQKVKTFIYSRFNTHEEKYLKSFFVITVHSSLNKNISEY